MHPTPASIEDRLSHAMWKAADTLRGSTADPWTETLPQLAVLLLLRWVDLVDAELEAIALFNGEDYDRVLPRELAWDTWAGLQGPELTDYLQHKLVPALADTRSDALSVDLSHPSIKNAFSSPGDLETLVQAVAEIPFETAADQRHAGEIFGELIRKTVTKSRYSGAFATPPAVAELMARLAAPAPGERIFDPCFGSGEVLIHCIDKLHQSAEFHTAELWERVQAESVFGVEISPAIHLIGLVRVLLAGVHHPGLVLGDALQRPLENGHAQRFDVVVAVPPWGKRGSSEATAHGHLPFKTNTLESTFLQLSMASLRPGGRAVVAVPNGLLFRGGAEQALRKWLLEEHHLEAVLQMPPGVFLPYTGVQFSLLLLSKAGSAEQVRFVDLNVIGETLSLERDVDEIISWVRGESTDGPVRVVGLSELAKQDWNLIAPSEAEQELQVTLKELEQLEDVEVVSLADLASLNNGLSYTRAMTTDNSEDPEAHRGLIRVRDVDKRRVKSPSLFARQELVQRAKEGQVLRSGDLVVTTSGSIGRVGTVASGSVGCITTNGVIVVRPRQGVSGRYLGGLLRSPILQELMKAQARGMAVQHLPLSVLKRIRLPCPPIPIQERIADAIEYSGGDALALLRIVLTEDTHPVVTFLESDPAAQAVRQLREELANVRIGETLEDPVAVLRLFGKGLKRTLIAPDDPTRPRFSDEISSWVSELRPIADGLAGAATDAVATSAVPIQLSTQSTVVSALKEASRFIPEGLGIHSRGLERTLDSARELMAFANYMLAHDVAIEVFQVHLKSHKQGVLFETPALRRTVTLGVSNTGSAPLLRFEAVLSASPSVPLLKISEDMLLGEQEEHYAIVIPDELEESFRAMLSWKGTTATLDPVNGEVTVDLSLGEAEDHAAKDTEPEAMGSSPYIVGNPVDRPEMFFGREDILDKMRLHLSQDGVANVILLEGNRRTGKTSILKSLQRPDTLPSHVPVYCSFQASAGDSTKVGVPTDEVFKTIGRALAGDCALAGCPLPIPDTPDDLVQWPMKKRKAFVHMKLPSLVNAWFRERAAFTALDSLVAVAVDAVAPRRLLLMLDEFDKLQEGIDSGVTSPQVPENIRYLFQNNTGMAGVLTGSRRISRLREEYWNALFGFGFPIPVSALPQDAAENLVQKPVAGRLTYQPDAIERITTLCARHPFLIQLLCARVFDRAVEDKARHVTKKQVDAAVEDMIRDNEHFRTLWGYASSERARYILRLCHDLQDGPDPVTFDLLQNKLEAARVGYGFGDGSVGGRGDGSGLGFDDIISADGLRDDLDHLRELELISQVPDGTYHVYRLTVPLMGLWIERNVDCRGLLKLAVQEGRAES